jgi:transcriptional regulator with XRE-family HTH domain
MELSLPEKIQICRRRAGLNQGTLGAAAFDTSFESGRTKVKNLELGRQKPTPRDIENLARVLKLPVSALTSNIKGQVRGFEALAPPGIAVSEKTIDRFPGLDAYLEMLNKAVLLDDGELIDYISEKLARLFAEPSQKGGQITEASN